MAKGCSAVVYAAALKDSDQKIESISNNEINRPASAMSTVETESNASENSSTGSGSTTTIHNDITPIEQYPLALKMMFNYDIQSNAMAILQAMYREMIPIIYKLNESDVDGWERALLKQTATLPPHPNIVTMFGSFCAQIPELMGSTSLWPMALPQRINPNGYGRNMSLFLLMKRYEKNLSQYLKSSSDIAMRTRLMLFTQLLEGVAHLYRHGVAHRDLKSDNLLVDVNGHDKTPILVLSDFGCCIADRNNGLNIPYTSMNVDKGGNIALMAPEIITKMPGTFSILDYSKSDLWSCGAIAYEIFGAKNPFYKDEIDLNNTLKSNDYSECDLPALDSNVPLIVRKLIENILQRNPKKRLSADVAANVMQLFLWAPSIWLKSHANIKIPDILEWLLALTTKVLYERNVCDNGTSTMNGTCTEFLLLTSFLSRVQLQNVRNALDWIKLTVNAEENY